MRLLYLANIRFPTEKAHGVQIMKMCEAFSNAGMEVELVVPRRLNKLHLEDPFDFYNVRPAFKIKRLPCADLVFLGRVGFLIQESSFYLVAKIYSFFKNGFVVYTRDLHAGLFFRDFILELHALPRLEIVHKFIFSRVKTFIVLTSFLKNRLVNNGVVENKIIIAPDAVDLEEFNISISKEAARSKFSLPADKILVGYVGMLKTMDMSKGIDIAIESFKNIPDNIFLVLVGGSEEDIAEYRNFAIAKGLENRIIFTGRVKHELVPYYLRACDVLIAPFPETEHYKFYMSPMKFFEYMAAKKPIISTDLPAVREILNENNSVIIKPNSSEELALGIKKIISDKIFSDKISANAYNDVKQYTWNKRAKSIINIFHSSVV